MGLFGGSKKFCPVCGNKSSWFLPLKVGGEPLCSECASKILELPNELQDSTLESMENIRAYFAVFDENQALRQSFQQTYRHDFGILGGSICLDTAHRLLRLSTADNAFVFAPENIKFFRISEDSAPLFEGTKDELVYYQSTAPDRVRNMGREVDRFRIELRQCEQMRHMEEEMARQAKERGDTYTTRYISLPDVSTLNPFQKYYVSIQLDHPYRKVTKEFKETGPGFSDCNTSIEDYLNAYETGLGEMRALADNLMAVINPTAPVRQVSAPAGAQPDSGVRTAPVDAVAEIQKYKGLLDSGIITEEEFSAKKRQLLGI